MPRGVHHTARWQRTVCNVQAGRAVLQAGRLEVMVNAVESTLELDSHFDHPPCHRKLPHQRSITVSCTGISEPLDMR